MKGIIKDSLILFAITIIAGFFLGLVYDITKEPIAKQQQITKDNACRAVFAEADSFEECEVNGADTGFDGGDIEEVLAAKDTSGNILGYVLTVSEHEGYGGDVVFLIGIQKDGTVNGISFTSLSETAGLGMKAKDSRFKDQFNGKKVESFVFTKNGATKENEIDAISAATITTTAVTKGVNGALDFFFNYLQESEAVAGGVQ
ncbi:MAG: RnfABCDGE type electron transport complex subunit G [Lachnospiraceae bacterium]